MVLVCSARRTRRLLSDEELWGRCRRSNSPPPPPIAAPLLEMGFTLKHILKAIYATKSSGEVSAHTINMLATWMIEHPCIEVETSNRSDEVEGYASTASRSAESTSANRLERLEVSRISRFLPLVDISRQQVIMLWLMWFLNINFIC